MKFGLDVAIFCTVSFSHTCVCEGKCPAGHSKSEDVCFVPQRDLGVLGGKRPE